MTKAKPMNKPLPTPEKYELLSPAQRRILLDTLNKKDAFIEALKATYTVWTACKAAGIGSRRTVYNWRETDEEFAKAWDDAIEDAVDELEMSMYAKALSGKDTIASIFMLKGGRPDKYKERVANEHTGKNGGPIEIDRARDNLSSAIIGIAKATEKAPPRRRKEGDGETR